MQHNLDLNTQTLANHVCETVFTDVQQTNAHPGIIEYFRGIEVGLASGEIPSTRLNGKTLFSQVWTVESEGVQGAIDAPFVHDETAAYSLQMHNFAVSPSPSSGSIDIQGNLSPAGYDVAWPSSSGGYPVASSSSSHSHAPFDQDFSCSSFASSSSFGSASFSPSAETESYALNLSVVSDSFPCLDNATLYSNEGFSEMVQGGSSYAVQPDHLPVTLPDQSQWQSMAPHSYYGDGNAADEDEPDVSAMEYGYGGSEPGPDFADLFPESGSSGGIGKHSELDWKYFGFK